MTGFIQICVMQIMNKLIQAHLVSLSTETYEVASWIITLIYGFQNPILSENLMFVDVFVCTCPAVYSPYC
jgi:hypothetical protein